MNPLRSLGSGALQGLKEALESGRLRPPYLAAGLATLVPPPAMTQVQNLLLELDSEGMAPRHIERMVGLLLEERRAGQERRDRLQWVWSPPELDRVDARDTAVVVQELFRRAQRRVLIASFALDEGERAAVLFGELARRMEELPELKVCLLVNVHRKYQDETPASTLLRQFAQRWRDRGWPGGRQPELFYDPRSLETDPQKRAVMHAKVVVVDGRWALVSSANFTEAAQERNMEAGVLVEDVRFSERVERQFSELVEEGTFRRVVGVEKATSTGTGANEGKEGSDGGDSDHD